MLAVCLYTLAGAYSLECFRQLPGEDVLSVCLVASCLLFARRGSRPLAWFLLGFVLMGACARLELNARLDPQLAGQRLTLSARIVSFPEQNDSTVQFVVQPLNQPGLPPRIRLSWFEAETIPRIGETWRLTVRLRRPRGFANPGGFDFAGWLFREGIGATGSVDELAANYRIHGEAPSVVKALRAKIVARLTQLLPADAANGVLLAIGAGARHTISREAWDLYARTGTTHLMAISGLHIGLAAGSAYLICWGVCALAGARYNIRDVALIVALLAAALYATLSGFAVPSRRALLMICVASGASLLRRRLQLARLLAIPCMVIFVTNPLAILAPGFKLSFAAVAILMIVSHQHVSMPSASGWPNIAAAFSWVRTLSRLQLALLIGLCPFTVLIFSRVAPGAPLINMLVLPIFNLVTVPLTLLGIVLDGPFSSLGDLLLQGAHQSVRLTLEFLEIADNSAPLSQLTRHLSGPLVVATLLTILHVLLPLGWPGRKVALLAVLAVITYRPPLPPYGCLDYRVFDVGQGLAVLLQTAENQLLFDTGPAYRTGRNIAELVVLPYLYGQGLDRLDQLIVSHADLDHAGGVQTILDTLPVGRILVGEPLTHIAAKQVRCVAGIGWKLDGVAFSILHPRIRAPWTRNNASCVLEITAGEHRILLSGDIETPVETLLAYRGAWRDSHVVIVPHHGSRTSSTTPLVRMTQPAVAIVATGFANRWGFPKPEVVARWQAAGSILVNTATAGSVAQRLCAGTPPGRVQLARPDARKYWHDAP